MTTPAQFSPLASPRGETDDDLDQGEPQPRILIVDDTKANRRLYAGIVTELGAIAVQAENGEEAMQAIAAQRFALVLLDVHLPDTDGFELARRMREMAGCKKVPIVFISAVYTRDTDAFRGYALGAVDYILAPVVPDILRAKIQVYLELRTAQYELEQQAADLRDANAALQDAYNELESFSYSVSHDLRNPLHAMDGLARLLLQDPAVQDSASARELADGIASATQRMLVLIENLMQLSRVTRSELHMTQVDLSVLARDIVRELSRRHTPRVVECRIGADLTAWGDIGLINVLLGNLIGNAWKYTQRKAEPEIVFDALRDRDPVVYFVRDNGVGFDPTLAEERLFKPFRRLHPGGEFEGTGVGLAIAQRIVRRHGGNLWAESKIDDGATFYFTLPGGPDGDDSDH